MVVRELKDGSCIVSTQEDHAELSAQLAAHWGNRAFARLEPYSSMVLATTYHDSGYREWEGNPPIDLEKGRPYGHRETTPDFESTELRAYVRNVEWVREQDRYAGLLVSMHRTGLWENRYNTMTSPAGRLRERSAAVKLVKQNLETAQKAEIDSLGGGGEFTRKLWFNYRLLQVFDILSLYFGCDGYSGDGQLKPDRIAPVPLAYDGTEETELRLIPLGPDSVRIDPYPFDRSPLAVSLRVRILPLQKVESQEAGLEAYHQAERRLLRFQLVS
jgi:hypothetical protein